MWVLADGGSINCDHLQKIKVVPRQDGKHYVLGIAPYGNVVLSEHDTSQSADEALRTLHNRLNRERK